MHKINYLFDLGTEEEDFIIYFDSFFNFQINDEIDLSVFDELNFDFFSKIYKVHKTDTFLVVKRWISFSDKEVLKLNEKEIGDHCSLKINVGESVFVNIKLEPKK